MKSQAKKLRIEKGTLIGRLDMYRRKQQDCLNELVRIRQCIAENIAAQRQLSIDIYNAEQREKEQQELSEMITDLPDWQLKEVKEYLEKKLNGEL